MQLLNMKQTRRTVEEIPLNRLKPNPYCARGLSDLVALNSLAKNIGQVGVLEPILVRKIGENDYQIVSGDRRVKACRLAGLKTVPCIVLGISQRKSALFWVAENVQRKEMNVFEEAEAIKQVVDFYGMTVDDAGLKLGFSGEEIRRKLGVLKLSQEERDFCRQLGATKEDILDFCKIEEKNLRLEALERIAKGELGWKNAEKINEILEEEAKKSMGLRKNSGVFSNKSLFFRTIDRAVEILNAAGGSAVMEKISDDKQTVFVITVEN